MKRFFSKPAPSTRRLIAASYSASLLLALSACGPIHVDGLPHVSLGDDVSASAQPHLLGQFIDDRIMSVPDSAKTYGQARQNADAVDAALIQLAEMEPSRGAFIRSGLAVCIGREETALHATQMTNARRIKAALDHESCAKAMAVELKPKRT
ncbi:hypothetical protein [Acetobacter sp.]|uniref:hypothetical protein n=1 Tax=Acetobacter sp. TaxID=440 RepID=UPI0039EBC447